MRGALLLILLAAWAAEAKAGLVFERELDPGPSFNAYLVSYLSDGLQVYAMVAVPRGQPPDGGYPVVIANHGYVPDPRRYGITAEGADSRPGDYYRSVPELYTSRGFLVILPDYRGHNSSEGYEQIKAQNRDSVDLYARDVIALVPLIGDIEHADVQNLFVWSHSMGGAVSLRVQLVTKRIRAASYWSTVSVSDLVERFGELAAPIMIQHSVGDQTSAIDNSRQFRDGLAAIGRDFSYHEYDVAEHYFSGAIRETAADRDAEFFQKQSKH